MRSGCATSPEHHHLGQPHLPDLPPQRERLSGERRHRARACRSASARAARRRAAQDRRADRRRRLLRQSRRAVDRGAGAARYRHHRDERPGLRRHQELQDQLQGGRSSSPTCSARICGSSPAWRACRSGRCERAEAFGETVARRWAIRALPGRGGHDRIGEYPNYFPFSAAARLTTPDSREDTTHQRARLFGCRCASGWSPADHHDPSRIGAGRRSRPTSGETGIGWCTTAGRRSGGRQGPHRSYWCRWSSARTRATTSASGSGCGSIVLRGARADHHAGLSPSTSRSGTSRARTRANRCYRLSAAPAIRSASTPARSICTSAGAAAGAGRDHLDKASGVQAQGRPEEGPAGRPRPMPRRARADRLATGADARRQPEMGSGRSGAALPRAGGSVALVRRGAAAFGRRPGTPQVREARGVPIAMGKQLCNRFEFWNYVQPRRSIISSPMWEGRRHHRMAQDRGARPRREPRHVATWGARALLHLAGAIPNAPKIENIFGLNLYDFGATAKPLPIKAGRLALTGLPGHGVVMDGPSLAENEVTGSGAIPREPMQHACDRRARIGRKTCVRSQASR